MDLQHKVNLTIGFTKNEGGKMKNTNRLLGLTALSLILLCTTFNFAQDWPQWRGPDRDGKVTGFDAPQTDHVRCAGRRPVRVRL